MNKATNIVLIILVAIGALFLISLAGMWMMHGMMMGGPMNGSLFALWLIPVLLVGLLVVGLVLLFTRSTKGP